MAKTLNFFELKEAATKDAAEGLTIEGPNGPVHLRPVMVLPKSDLKLVYKHIDAIQAKGVSELDKIDAMDNALVAAADKKDRLKVMLDDLPLAARLEIFEGWMEAAEVPEA
ncbi:hypothetical protein ACFYYS_06195 [Streptomyces sp. NPDC002120]|uniref:hypothetical protein n=1 Tax=Streptomyces sp. NPDC002120 TaxID=3364631 RepID=UPI00367D8E2B